MDGAERNLIVDDDEDAADLLAMLVRALLPTSQIVTAPSGSAAVEIAQRWFPDLVLLDIEMPLVDGIEVATRLRRLLAGHLPRIVALTGAAGRSAELAALPVFDEVRLKPVDAALIEALCA